MNTFYDKVYQGEIIDKDILSDVLKLDSKDAAKSLAGDLADEKYVILTDVFREKLERELQIHLERIYGAAVSRLDLFDEGVETDAIWVNRQFAGEYNPTHSHSGYLSYVFYPELPEVIREEHKDQKGNSMSRGLIQFLSERTNDKLLLNPKKGDIFIFNSEHNHAVYPFYSDVERISVAGNIFSVDIDGYGTLKNKKFS